MLINFNRSLFIQQLWNLLSDMSYIMNLALISYSVPGISQEIQGSMLNIIYMDILRTDLWLIPMIFPNDDGSNDYAINPQFNQSGYNSMLLIKNLNSTFVYLIVIIVLFPVSFIMKMFGSIGRKGGIMLDQKLRWGICIRFIIQQFPPMLTASLINLYDFTFVTGGDGFSSILSAVLVVTLNLSLILMIRVIRESKTLKNSQSFQLAYQTLFEGLNTKNTISRYWTVLTLFRWEATLLIFIVLQNYPQIQVILLLIQSQVFTIMLSTQRPQRERAEQNAAILNEVFTSAYLYLMMCLMLCSGDISQYFGWAIIGTIFLNVLFNVIKFIIQVLRITILYIKKMKSKNLLKRYELSLQNSNQQMKKDTIEQQLKPIVVQYPKTRLFAMQTPQKYVDKVQMPIVRIASSSPSFLVQNNDGILNQPPPLPAPYNYGPREQSESEMNGIRRLIRDDVITRHQQETRQKQE